MEYPVNESYMDEQEIHLRDIFMVLSVRKWAVILGAGAIILGAVLYLITAEPVYEAEVTMLYEKSNPTTALLDNIDFKLFQSELELDAQKAFLMSPIVLNEAKTKLLKEYGLLLTDKQIEELLDLTSPRGTNVLKLKAKARTPSTAALIANTVASVYIEKSAERKRSDLDSAVNFLQNQLTAIDQRLEKSYEELAKFREKEGLVATPTNEGLVVPGLLQKLGQMQEELEATEIEIGLTQASLNSVKDLIEEKKRRLNPSVQGMTVPGGLTPQIEVLRKEIIDLQLELDAKKQRYTEKHQEVKELERKLRSAQDRLNKEVMKLSKVQGETLDPLTEWQNLISQQIQLEVKLKELEEKKKLLESKIEKFKVDHPDLVAKDVQLMQLEKERKMLEETYKTLKAKLEEMELMRRMRTADVSIVKEAIEPRLPVKPKIKLTIALAVVLGTMFGVGLAFLWEYMDNTIKTKEEIERLTGLSVVGVIPKLDKSQLKDMRLKPLPSPGNENIDGGNKPGTAIVKRRRKGYQQQIEELVQRKLTNLKPRNPVVESYRAIRSNIRYASVDRSVKSVLITSSLPGEGKSLTVANLAITFAKSGAKTVLLDCDLHRPKLHYMFGVEKSPGMSELLTGQIEGDSLEEEIKRITRQTEVENLFLITSGRLPPNPGDLLASEKVKEILENLKLNFDMVLVDSPPLGLASDTSVLATRTDTTILIVRAGQTKRPSVVQAKEMLEHLGANIFGVIINELDTRSRRYSDYYYYYYSKYSDYYSPDEEEET